MTHPTLAGWYPAQDQPDTDRWWDGQQWTAALRQLPPPARHPSEQVKFVPPPVAWTPAVAPAPRRSTKRLVAIIIGAGVLLTAAGAAVAMTGSAQSAIGSTLGVALLVGVVVGYLKLAVEVGHAAARKGRSDSAWFLIAALFGLWLPAIIVAALGHDVTSPPHVAVPTDAPAVPPLETATGGITQGFQELSRLKALGLVSENEFDSKRRDLLNRI